MPKRRSGKVLSDKNEVEESKKNSYNETVSLQIMKDLDVTPLDNSFSDEYDCDVSLPTAKKKRFAHDRNTENIYQRTPGKKGSDDFVLFRKQNNSSPSGLDYFSKVSDEVILQIFELLPKHILVKCSQVNKRWRGLSYDETLWRRYDFGHRCVKPRVLEILLQRGIQVLRLAQSEIKSPVFTPRFSQDSEWVSDLQYLDLSMAAISSEELAVLISKCRHLKKLSLENCVLNDDCCSAISQNKNIIALNMTMCQGLTTEGLCRISQNCTKLKEWNLAWVHLTYDCLQTVLPTMPPSLRRINLSGHRENLDDPGLVLLLERCPNLTELDVSDCMYLGAHSFEFMVNTCTKLEHLHTSRCINIPTDSNRLLKKLKHFKKLEIFRTLTDEALAALRKDLPHIEINKSWFSTIARPTVGDRRTSLWGLKVRE